MSSFLQVTMAKSRGSAYLDSTISGFHTDIRIVGTSLSNAIPRAAAQIQQSDSELWVEENVQDWVVYHGRFGHHLWNHGVGWGDTFMAEDWTYHAGNSVGRPADNKRQCHGYHDP